MVDTVPLMVMDKNPVVDAGFDYGELKIKPNVFLQWKGTDVCLDFHCECDKHLHFDGDFAYELQCPYCETIWEMPWNLYPRKTQRDTKLSICQRMQKEDDDNDGEE